MQCADSYTQQYTPVIELLHKCVIVVVLESIKDERKEESKHDGNMVTITLYYTPKSTPAIERLSTLESYSQDLC